MVCLVDYLLSLLLPLMANIIHLQVKLHSLGWKEGGGACLFPKTALEVSHQRNEPPHKGRHNTKTFAACELNGTLCGLGKEKRQSVLPTHETTKAERGGLTAPTNTNEERRKITMGVLFHELIYMGCFQEERGRGGARVGYSEIRAS